MIITKLNERYVFERELGRGAFGVAYLARDKHIHLRRVVIKILFEAEGQTFDDASFRMMFEREIKALAGINHPYVVHIYDFGWTPEGQPFIAMQYVEGKTLRAAMDGRSMEPKRVALIVSQLGSALSAVHNAGVIHRDLKPENVMLHLSSGDELAILIDFGIARVEVARAGQPERETWAGTPFYMAPEQLKGHPVTASDVWALGVVAYELVTGRRPFSAADVIMLKDGPLPASFMESRASCFELSKAAQSVILKALSYDLDLRYTHAHEMGKEFLRAITEGGPLDPSSVPKSAEELRPNSLPLVGPSK
ncbi:MAG TPA: serine/threonine-protein kinase [Pyrinomonadaceae bacterium]|nr:serine/threonine-protein kinase [Pyrinomonadaceae bacterium]